MSLYIRDSVNRIHRGAIFRFSPFFWSKHPLWITRISKWVEPRRLTLHPESELHDAFQVVEDKNEEHIIVKAKRRYLIVVSNENENKNPKISEVLVAPIYSIDGKSNSSEMIEMAINNPSKFYLPYDSNFSEIKDSFVDLRKIRLHDKKYLDKKLNFSINETGIKALLNRYIDYISMDNPENYIKKTG